VKYKLFKILNLNKFNLILGLIFLSIGINEFYINTLLYRILGTNNYLWVLRLFVIVVLIFYQLNNYRYFKKLDKYYCKLFLCIMFSLAFSSLSYMNNFFTYWASHFFYIYIIFFLLMTKELLNQETIKYIGKLLLFLGFVSIFGYYNLIYQSSDTASFTLDLIGIPTIFLIGALLLSFNRIFIFHILITVFLIIFYIKIERSAFLATLIFYLIIQKKDFGIFKKFSYLIWILLSFVASLITGFVEFNQAITEAVSTGRGHIWWLNLEQFINGNYVEILFGKLINYIELTDKAHLYSPQINLPTDNFNQLHSISIKTLLDYGIIGFILIVLIFKKNNKVFNKFSIIAKALFFFCLTISALNSSTNFLKFDIYGLLMFFALALSNKTYYLKSNLKFKV
jgi:hypothetical protein